MNDQVNDVLIENYRCAFILLFKSPEPRAPAQGLQSFSERVKLERVKIVPI